MLYPAEELVGVVGTFSLDATLDILPDVRNDILYEDEDFSPIMTFQAHLSGVEKTHNTTFRWPEQIIDKYAVTSGAIGVTGAGLETGNITFASANMRVGDFLFNPASGQRYQVTTWVSRTTSVSVVRLTRVPFTSAGTAITGTVAWRVLGNHVLEGQWLPIGTGGKPTWYNNTVEEQAQTATITRIMENVSTWYSNPASQFELDNQIAWRAIFSGIERSFLFGSGVEELRAFTNEEGNRSSGTGRETTGMMTWVTDVASYPGDFDKATLNAFMFKNVFGGRNSGDRRKMMATGMNIFEAIDDMANNQLRYLPGAKELGLDIAEIKTAGTRSLYLVEEREFMNDPNASEYSDTALVYDPNLLGIKHLSGSYIEVKPMQTGLRTIRGIEYYACCGLEIRGRGKAHIITKTPS